MAVKNFLLPLAYAIAVAAHGRVSEVVVKGVAYQGYNGPAWASNPNPPKVLGWTIRQPDLGFVEPASFGTPDIICHKDAKPGQAHVEVAAGDVVSIVWTPWPVSHVGAIIDYLADCNGPCESVDKTTLQFFKIDAVGLVNQSPPTFGTNGMIANKNTWQVQVPKDLAPGNYVLRHELLALHSAGQQNGAQSYPQCFNLKVTGSGTLKPAGVKGTELYKATDPGILVNIYQPSFNYIVPGPNLIPGVPPSCPQAPVQAVATSTATPGDGNAIAPITAKDFIGFATSIRSSIATTTARPSMGNTTARPSMGNTTVPSTGACSVPVKTSSGNSTHPAQTSLPPCPGRNGTRSAVHNLYA